jgi:hypothetical protein
MPLASDRQVNEKPLEIGINSQKYARFDPLDREKIDFLYTSIPQVGEKWLAVVAASDSCRGHDSRWLS